MVFLSKLAPVCVMGLASILTLGFTPESEISSDVAPKESVSSVQSKEGVSVASAMQHGRAMPTPVATEGEAPIEEELPSVDLPVVEVKVVNEEIEKINEVIVKAPSVGQIGVKGFKTVALGEFKVRAFCGGKCCNQGGNAQGMRNYEGVNVAVDPNVIPYGTMVMIDGVGIRQAQPTNQKVSGREIRVYVGNHSKVKSFGEKTVKVVKVV